MLPLKTPRHTLAPPNSSICTTPLPRKEKKSNPPFPEKNPFGPKGPQRAHLPGPTETRYAPAKPDHPSTLPQRPRRLAVPPRLCALFGRFAASPIRCIQLQHEMCSATAIPLTHLNIQPSRIAPAKTNLESAMPPPSPPPPPDSDLHPSKIRGAALPTFILHQTESAPVWSWNPSPTTHHLVVRHRFGGVLQNVVVERLRVQAPGEGRSL